MARMMRHAKSTLVDQVHAHTMQSGMASVAENVTARAACRLLVAQRGPIALRCLVRSVSESLHHMGIYPMIAFRCDHDNRQQRKVSPQSV